jgi:hypothetical protein
MSHLLPGRAAKTAPEKVHKHHVKDTVSAVMAHIPHSLPEPHVHYPPLHPSYLEDSRMSREAQHL